MRINEVDAEQFEQRVLDFFAPLRRSTIMSSRFNPRPAQRDLPLFSRKDLAAGAEVEERLDQAS